MVVTVFQYIILGIIQGITEWLPISSSGVLVLVMSNFLGITDVSFLLHAALFLHLGTFFAALVYFRKDAFNLIKTLFSYNKAGREEKSIFNFILISTIITGAIGLLILYLLDNANLELTGKTISFAVGFLLLITGIFQIKTKTRGLKKAVNLKRNDSIILGFMQGLSSLPGLSRSGITISTLLLKKFDDTSALRLSFLMSLPVVLLGNILLNLNDFSLTSAAFYGLFVAFIFGLLTIHGMMKLSRKINFGWFVLIFALLMMLGVVF
jgi:undecaprenyl-diphosphatase